MELLFKAPGHVLGESEIAEAVQAGVSRIEDAIEQGAALLPSVEKPWELVPMRIEKALRRFMKKWPIPSDWHTFQTELTFPDHGHCRVDLLHGSDLGPCITDFKTKVTAADYIVDNFMADSETSWQMMHYVWAARQMGIQVDSFAICLIIIEPFHIHLDQWLVDEERLARWVIDAHKWWQLMEMVETQQLYPMRVGDHRDKYGLCSYHGMCFPDGWVPELVYKREWKP